VSFRDGENGRLLAFCFGGCGFIEVLSAAAEIDQLDGADDIGERDAVDAPQASKRERIELARRLYDRLPTAAGTPGERYWPARGITLAIPSTLRFGRCPHRCGGNFPALVAPIVDVDGALIGVHATFLRPDGAGKAEFANPDHRRETRGAIRGGSIRLAPHDPSRELLVAEGVETTAAAMQLFGLPGWSAVYAGNLKTTLALPSVVQRICIAADNDFAGRQAAAGAHRRWTAEGRTVRIVMPTAAGADFNDVLRGA
jgi:phage/plasmid primase-like uncharacterized protein